MGVNMNRFERYKATLYVRLFTMMKLPLLAWVRPSVIQMDENTTVLKIPLARRTKNHLNVMYFGALAMGGEATVALPAVIAIRDTGNKVNFLFKDFQANFLRRAEGDVHFHCEESAQVRELINKALKSDDRFEHTFRSFAVVPSKDPNEVIAEFKVTMTVKARRKT